MWTSRLTENSSSSSSIGVPEGTGHHGWVGQTQWGEATGTPERGGDPSPVSAPPLCPGGEPPGHPWGHPWVVDAGLVISSLVRCKYVRPPSPAALERRGWSSTLPAGQSQRYSGFPSGCCPDDICPTSALFMSLSPPSMDPEIKAQDPHSPPVCPDCSLEQGAPGKGAATRRRVSVRQWPLGLSGTVGHSTS